MSQSNIDRPLAQDPSGTLHAGVDLALEKNVVVVVNEKAQRLDHFSFPQDRGGYDYFLRRLERLRQKHQAAKVVVAMEPTNYFWKLLARELEEKQHSYRLVNAYTVKKHREGDQLDRSKDDRRDAAQIAELSRNGKTTQTQLQKGAYEDLRQYATLYHQLMQSIRREKTILWGLVGQVFPEMVRAFKDLEGGDLSSVVDDLCRCSRHPPDVHGSVPGTGPGNLLRKKAVYLEIEARLPTGEQLDWSHRWPPGYSTGHSDASYPTASLRNPVRADNQRPEGLFALSPRSSLPALVSLPKSDFGSPFSGGGGRSTALPKGRSMGQISWDPACPQFIRQETAQPDSCVPSGSPPPAHFALFHLLAHGPARYPLRSALC
jgi:hypothetical protein